MAMLKRACNNQHTTAIITSLASAIFFVYILYTPSIKRALQILCGNEVESCTT